MNLRSCVGICEKGEKILCFVLEMGYVLVGLRDGK